MNRILAREKNRYGKEINIEGKMYKSHIEFMEWASKYDSGDLDIRSKKLHYEWIEKIECKVLKIEEDIEVNEKVKRVIEIMDTR